MSVKKNILKNGVAATIQKIVKVAEQLFLIPFFIKYWGAGYYGEWLTLTVVPAFLALSDFGFGSAAANTFLLQYAAGDKQSAANTSKTGVTVLTYLILAAILLSALIVIILNYFNVFDKSLIDAKDAMWAVIILLTSKIIGFYQQIFEAYFRAARRASLSINLITIISIINIISGMLVLLFGGKVVAYSLVSLGVSLILYPMYVFIAKRALALHKEFKGHYSKSEVKTLTHVGFGYFLAPIWQAIYFQGCTFVVRLVLGPIAVTIFNTVRTVIRSSSQAFAMIIIATYPDFQFEMGAGNFKKARKIFLGVLGINIIIAVIFILGLGLFGDKLYSIWTHKALVVPYSVWLVFIVSIIFYALWFTFSFIFEALNKPYTYTLASLICAIISVCLSWFLCFYMGLTGAALGNLSFDLFMCIYLIPKGAKVLNMGTREVLIESLQSAKNLLIAKIK
jgi:O-antigen/teichoic acid export membrane protein